MFQIKQAAARPGCCFLVRCSLYRFWGGCKSTWTGFYPKVFRETAGVPVKCNKPVSLFFQVWVSERNCVVQCPHTECACVERFLFIPVTVWNCTVVERQCTNCVCAGPCAASGALPNPLSPKKLDYEAHTSPRCCSGGRWRRLCCACTRAARPCVQHICTRHAGRFRNKCVLSVFCAGARKAARRPPCAPHPTRQFGPNGTVTR